ncbi:T-cell receptor beta chain V region YT35, partial [Sciurus carolinensis]|nr:T-cell receptor beta chain V region YT35 [Sciurus carolinensis]
KPSRDICQHGTSVTIQCQVDSQLALMFWYHQLPRQSLMLIATANQGSEATYESGFAKDKFPISRPNLTFSTLTVNNVSPEDSSLYLCSAGDTVLGTDQRSEQEPQLPPTQLPTNDPEDPARMEQGKPPLLGRDCCLCVCGQAWTRMVDWGWTETLLD